MTLPTISFAFLNDSTARALYGAFHPGLWHAVEAYLLAHPRWAHDLYRLETDELAAAVHATVRLQYITGYPEDRVVEAITATSDAISIWRSENTHSDLEALALSSPFELALFGTLAMPGMDSPNVIRAYLDWKVPQIKQHIRHLQMRSMKGDPSDLLGDVGAESKYWSELCNPGLDIPGSSSDDSCDFNLDEIC